VRYFSIFFQWNGEKRRIRKPVIVLRMQTETRIKKMIKINPINLKVPIHGRVGKIKAQYPDYKSKMIIYFSGRRFEWVQTTLTPDLVSDLSAICGTADLKDWFGREVEVYSSNGSIRARLP
jgi:hypothetical protein